MNVDTVPYTGTSHAPESGREFYRSHPWITFELDLLRAPAKLWILLGEARSKCEHIAGVPLRPSVADRLHGLYLAKGARATTAIEGNTLTEDEVGKLIKGIRDLPPSKEYLGTEVENILGVCNELLQNLSEGTIPILSLERIKELNRRVLADLALEPGVAPGVIPTRPVGVGRYRGAPRQDCDYLLSRLCEWLNSPKFNIDELGLAAAILKAIIAHLYLAWIHPFGDGNGRTGRLIEFQILVSSGVPSPAAHLLSNHYNETRSEYYRQLDTASQTRSPVEFITYALQGFVDGLQAQIKLIRYQQWEVTWENYVHDAFHSKNSRADNRRRHLVLDLSGRSDIVPRSELRTLTPRLAAAYADKTSKTLTRDLNVLQDMGLITRSSEGIVANKEMILAFLPPTSPSGAPSSSRDPQLSLPLE